MRWHGVRLMDRGRVTVSGQGDKGTRGQGDKGIRGRVTVSGQQYGRGRLSGGDGSNCRGECMEGSAWKLLLHYMVCNAKY